MPQRRSPRRKPAKRSAKSRTARRSTVVAYHGQLCDRLNSASGGATFDKLGKMTGTNHETVRRYMQSGRVPAQFLFAFSQAFGVDPAWLLTGRGTMKGKKR